MKVIEGNLIAKGKSFGIIASRFNEFMTRKLVDGCVDALVRHGVKDSEIELAWVPGSFEIPLLAKKMAQSKKYDAIICLGTIIRGDTPHFDFVANESAKGIAQVSLETGVPAVFGIITADNLEQAIKRAGSKEGNKGADAALSAIEMVNLIKGVGK
ncbi:MAG: 6,7-dimethyl-8-ribityllumazine synthase [Candidatus Omnitrophota bacterium]